MVDETEEYCSLYFLVVVIANTSGFTFANVGLCCIIDII